MTAHQSHHALNFNLLTPTPITSSVSCDRLESLHCSSAPSPSHSLTSILKYSHNNSRPGSAQSLLVGPSSQSQAECRRLSALQLTDFTLPAGSPYSKIRTASLSGGNSRPSPGLATHKSVKFNLSNIHVSDGGDIERSNKRSNESSGSITTPIDSEQARSSNQPANNNNIENNEQSHRADFNPINRVHYLNDNNSNEPLDQYAVTSVGNKGASSSFSSSLVETQSKINKRHRQSSFAEQLTSFTTHSQSFKSNQIKVYKSEVNSRESRDPAEVYMANNNTKTDFNSTAIEMHNVSPQPQYPAGVDQQGDPELYIGGHRSGGMNQSCGVRGEEQRDYCGEPVGHPASVRIVAPSGYQIDGIYRLSTFYTLCSNFALCLRFQFSYLFGCFLFEFFINLQITCRCERSTA